MIVNFEEAYRQADYWFEADLAGIEIPEETLNCFSADIAVQYQVLPVKFEKNDEGEESLLVITHLSENAKKITFFQEKSKMKVHFKFTGVENLRQGLIRHYGIKENAIEKSDLLLPVEEEAEEPEDNDLQDIQNGTTSPFIDKVNNIIKGALELGASDIHILPQENGSMISFRLDGDLEDFSQYYPINGRREKIKIVNRFKIVCEPSLDIGKRDIEQKGSFHIFWNERSINCRVSVLPTIRGEKVVIRLLDPTGELKDIETLGFPPEDIEKFRIRLLDEYGLTIIVGPTGSGKTTTNYAAVKYCWEQNKKINVSTLEDPPEYYVPKYAQVLVSDPKDFDDMLEALLRQDPNIILIGEIRNSNTAKIVVQASQTGHKVFTTLHATDCIIAMDRLFSMNVPRRELLAQLTCIASQRLLKLNCPDCSKIQTEFPSEIMDQLAAQEQEKIRSGTPKHGPGCHKCNQKGYIGRIAVAEFLFFDNKVRDFFADNRTLTETGAFLRDELNFRTMWEKGIDLVREGKVSLENMARVLSRRQL